MYTLNRALIWHRISIQVIAKEVDDSLNVPAALLGLDRLSVLSCISVNLNSSLDIAFG